MWVGLAGAWVGRGGGGCASVANDSVFDLGCVLVWEGVEAVAGLAAGESFLWATDSVVFGEAGNFSGGETGSNFYNLDWVGDKCGDFVWSGNEYCLGVLGVGDCVDAGGFEDSNAGG